MKLVVNANDVNITDVKTIYYSANTIWWTHDPLDLCMPTEEHLKRMERVFGKIAVNSFRENPVPVDAFNSPLHQTDNVAAWMDLSRISSNEAYGPIPEKRMEVLMWTHAKNLNLIMDKLLKAIEEDKEVITRFQKFYIFLEREVFIQGE